MTKRSDFVGRKHVLAAFDEQTADHSARLLIQTWCGVKRSEADKAIQRARDAGMIEQGGPLGERLSRKGRDELEALDRVLGETHQRRFHFDKET